MTLVNVAVVAGVAAITPVLVVLVPRRVVPGIVIEILAGLVLGPHGLGWIALDPAVDTLALLGLAFLFFLAGLEIDLTTIRGWLLARALSAYVLSVLLAAVMAVSLDLAGVIDAPTLVAVALSATGLGLVVPILRDADLLKTPNGRTVTAAASVAEFSAVVILALGFSSGGDPALNIGLLAALAGVAVLVAAAGRRLGAHTVVTGTIDRLSGGTSQLRVRLSVATVVCFAALALALGLEVVLGAFFAGGILNVLDRGMKDPTFRGRLDAIGYGFLIPVFFVTSGARLDLSSLSWWPDVLGVLALTFALLLARGLPALVLPLASRPAVLGAGLLCATSLPFIVTAAQLGLEQDRLTASTATAMTAAGLIGVCLFPAAGARLLRPALSSSTSWPMVDAALISPARVDPGEDPPCLTTSTRPEPPRTLA